MCAIRGMLRPRVLLQVVGSRSLGSSVMDMVVGAAGGDAPEPAPVPLAEVASPLLLAWLLTVAAAAPNSPPAPKLPAPTPHSSGAKGDRPLQSSSSSSGGGGSSSSNSSSSSSSSSICYSTSASLLAAGPAGGGAAVRLLAPLVDMINHGGEEALGGHLASGLVEATDNVT